MIGCWNNGGKSDSVVMRLNLRDGQLTSVCPMTRPREGAAAVASDQSIIVFGARGPRLWEVSPTCEIYDPIIDK